MNGTSRTIASVALTGLAFAAGPSLASAQTTGSITQDGVTMPVKAAMAVLSKNGLTVSFLLLSFVPTSEDVAALRAHKTEILLGRPGPDPKKWPRSTPYVESTISWVHDPQALGKLEGSLFTNLHGYNISPKGQFVSAVQGKKSTATLTGEIKPGATLTLTAAGVDGPEVDERQKNTVSWDFKATATVVTRLP
jgi:hypothetical protein